MTKEKIELIAKSVIGTEENFNQIRTITIIGSSGCGKTTTLAKLASRIIISAKKSHTAKPKIKFLTTDCVTVGAAEQLKKWAEVLQADFEKAENERLFHTELDCSDEYDYILIDTPPCNPNDEKLIAKFCRMFTKRNPYDVLYLAIPATNSAADIENAICKFERLNYNGIVLTKCDETADIKSVLCVIEKCNKKIAWLGTGLEANAIEQATSELILKFLKTEEEI